jgi:ribose-phosphate pyrophosphokinase
MNKPESQFGMSVFSGTGNPELSQAIVKSMKIPMGLVDIRRFPDGELHVKLKESVRGKDVFIVQSVCKEPNERLMELLIMIDTMRRASAERVTAVLPFYGYARQDRKDQPGVPITAKLVANLLVAAGADRVLTMDLHAQQIQGFFDIPVDHLYAFPVISKYLLEKKLNNPVVVSPDTGGVKTAYAYSKILGCGLAIVAKQRKGPDEVEALSLVGDVGGCTVIMVDDLTSTAGTFCSAAKVLKQNGAGDIYAAVTHGMITQQGVERIRASAITEMIVTDTVPTIEMPGINLTKLSVAPLLAEAITRIHQDRSVTSLFRS